MTFFAEGLAEAGYRVARFEFPYMARRRLEGTKRPPDRAPVLEATWRAVIDTLGARHLVVGGKSMGGRIASLVADDTQVRGLLCLGYPFYGAGRKDKPRVAHLLTLRTSALFCQGERDPMGDKASVGLLPFPESLSVQWLPDGDHDLKPRRASGRTHPQSLQDALDGARAFLAALR